MIVVGIVKALWVRLVSRFCTVIGTTGPSKDTFLRGNQVVKETMSEVQVRGRTAYRRTYPLQIPTSGFAIGCLASS